MICVPEAPMLRSVAITFMRSIDECRNRICDADAADQQRREADEDQELPQPLQHPRDLRRGIEPVRRS